MELLTGHPLSHEPPGRLSVLRTIRLLIPVCRALAEAHRHGIIHRDIKPDNVFLHRTPRGEMVKVVDFGIAKLAGAEAGDAHLTASGRIIGTPTYMAPERAAGKPHDGKADVYSVGVMAYEMLAGRLPFPATESNPFAVRLAHLNDAPPPLDQIAPHLPADLTRLVAQTLSKDPAKRPSAADLATALTELAHGLPPARTTAEPYRLQAPPPRSDEPATRLLAADTGDHGAATCQDVTVSHSPLITRPGTAPEATPTLIADEPAEQGRQPPQDGRPHLSHRAPDCGHEPPA